MRNITLWAAIIYIVILIAGIIGWVMNIVSMIHMETITGMGIARLVGIFIAPLGAVLGYF